MNDARIDEGLFTSILAQKLGSLFSKTIEALEVEELKKITPVADWDPALCSDEEREQARATVRKKIAETNKQVLYDYAPVLYEVEKTVLQNHRCMVREVTERLRAHRSEIGRTFLNGKDFSEVTQISGDGADIHNHGRLTLTITTPEGKFLYKPHSCMTDEVLFRLIASHFSDVVRVPRALDFGDHGFCEFFVNRPAEGREEASAYYQNLGGLSALVHAMGGMDFHCENLLADGRYPVPVDLETIITPTVRNFYEKGRLPDFLSDYNRSIAQSGLLPKRAGNSQFSPLLCTTFKNAGAPVVDGQVQTVRGYEAAFFAGFDAVYDRCIHYRAQIAAAVLTLADSPIRRLIRNTDSYAKTLVHLNSPQAARDREEQEKILRSPAKYFASRGLTHLMGIAQAETASLAERDIPYFYTFGKSTDLYSDGKLAAKDYFKVSAADHALERLERLSPEEKRYEKTLISRSLEYVYAERPSPSPVPELTNAEAMTREEALELSGRLLERIYEASLVSPSGKRGWLGHIGDGDSFSCLQMPLANGVGGICLFGLAAAALDGRYGPIAEEFAEIYQEQLDYYVQFFTDIDTLPPDRCDLGLTSGAAGVLLTLFLARQWMPELPLHHSLDSVCALLDRLPVEECTASDVYSGLAGLLLSLYRIREEADVGRQIRRIADRLLELKAIPCGDLLLWNTLPKTPRAISGYGHGCGGIGLALLRAWEMTGEERYRTAAEDAFAFEHGIYSEKLGAWPDLRRSPVADSTQYGICSGAPGIALCMMAAQKAGLPFADTDMERARTALLRQPVLPRDTLCCGNCSAAEALISLGLRSDAAALLGKIRKKAQLGGDYTFMPPTLEPFFVPNLFYGAAGLGYTLLRFAEPERIASVF